ncbi:diguanylate cyclase domain-containing protein [Escherichia coli]
MENIYGADTSRSAINRVWCCTVGAAAVTTCITVFAVKYSGRQQYWFGSGDSGRYRITQNAAPAELQRLHDALTHLANRASFEKQLRILLQTVNSTHQRHALVFIDL